MDKIAEFIIIIIILIVLWYYFTSKYTCSNMVNKENFKVNSQNWVYNNVYENADLLQYGKDDTMQGMFHHNPKQVMGPSDQDGVNQNSGQDVFDNRGFKWTQNAQNTKIDEFTAAVDNAQLRNKFERTYMLDPDGSVAQYDITYNEISPSCCPAQYAPPFKLTDKNQTNCDFAQKFVANNYSGMNYEDGYGCVCMTPKQADFYGTRGGNTY